MGCPFRRWRAGAALGILLAGTGVLPARAEVPEEPSTGPGWGVDAWLAGRVDGALFDAFVRRLPGDGVGIIRERGVGTGWEKGGTGGDIRPRLEALHRAGIRVVAFAGPDGALPARPGERLSVDLLGIYRGARRGGRAFAGLIDGWEMIGEPDTGFCSDLPDRVAAVQKALYLGLKAGAAEGETPDRLAAGYPYVSMGALGLPPGPWLERARRNGLLAYTDAYNFHFYGAADQLAGVIGAQRAAAGSDLPLWLTECGYKAVPPDDVLNGPRLRLEGRFLESAAREALRGHLALFMPFILYDPGSPYQLMLAPDRPLEPWIAYRAFMRAHPWPNRPWGRKTAAPNPVVLEWVPVIGTTVPHKVSGTYRFRGERPILGEIRVYNLGGRPVHGRLRWEAPAELLATTLPADSALSVAAGDEVARPVSLGALRAGYLRTTCRAVFTGADGSESAVEFGVERRPEDADFREVPLPLHPVAEARRPGRGGESASGGAVFGDPGWRVTSQSGPWTGLDGVVVDRVDPQGGLFRVPRPTGDPVGDPLRPPFAVTAVDGLPPDGFIRLRPDPPLSANMGVRVDLIDRDGARYTVFENLGQDYLEPRRDIWLALQDFHPFFWGQCPAPGPLRPDRVREIQLRFYPTRPGGSIAVSLALMRAGSPPSVPHP